MLLAAIAHEQKKRGLAPEQIVLDTLESLASQVDPTELGEDLADLAADLMSVRPQLALSLITRYTPDSYDSRQVDHALLRLSAITAALRPTAEPGMSAAMEDIQSKIKNPSARDLARKVSVLLESETGEDILRKVKALSSPGDQLFLLRQWCRHTDHATDAGPVIDYAVHLALRTSEYSPTSRDFRDLCEPLPAISDTNALRSLLDALDLHKDTARAAGPTQDYVRWQMLMAQAETRFSPVRGGQRICELYSEVSSTSDLDVKSVCLAIFVGLCDTVDPGSGHQETQTIRELARLDLAESVEKLLNLTADHYFVTRPIIEALAPRRPEIALEIIEDMNYEYRRDWALSDLSEYLTDRPDGEIDCAALRNLIGRWADRRREDTAIAHWLSRLVRISDCEILKRLESDIAFLVSKAREIYNPYQAAISMSRGLSLLRRCGGSDPAASTELTGRIFKAWEKIDEPSARILTGYKIAHILSDHAREFALAILSATDEEKASYNDLSRTTFLYCLRLGTRAFTGLLPQGLSTPTDLDRISALFDRVRSNSSQIALWGELAMRMFSIEKDAEARRVVGTKVRPMLDAFRQACPYEWAIVTAFVAPALYRNSSVGALDYVASLPKQEQEEALENILRFVVFGVPPDEPVSTRGSQGNHLSYETCVEVLSTLELCETDYLIYKYICIVADSATWRHNRYALTQEQRSQLSAAITKLGAKKFPNPRFIKHDGFAILAQAQATRLLKPKLANWAPLVQRSRDIPNLADRAFVLTFLAEALPPSEYAQKASLMTEARQLIAGIPSVRDRIEHLSILASAASEFNAPQAKEIIRQAAAVVDLSTTDELRPDELRRNLVDTAFQIDPDFAETLSSAMDTDHARAVARSRVAYQKTRKLIRDGKAQSDEIPTADVYDLEKICWDLVGTLNAKRATPIDVQSSVKVLSRMRGVPLDKCFRTFNWFVANMIRRRAYSEEAKSLLRETFECILGASEVAGALIARAAGQAVSVSRPRLRDSNSLLVGAGQREVAFRYISDWLANSGKGFLYICDPYFGVKELGALEIVSKASPGLPSRR